MTRVLCINAVVERRDSVEKLFPGCEFVYPEMDFAKYGSNFCRVKMHLAALAKVGAGGALIIEDDIFEMDQHAEMRDLTQYGPDELVSLYAPCDMGIKLSVTPELIESIRKNSGFQTWMNDLACYFVGESAAKTLSDKYAGSCDGFLNVFLTLHEGVRASFECTRSPKYVNGSRFGLSFGTANCNGELPLNASWVSSTAFEGSLEEWDEQWASEKHPCFMLSRVACSKKLFHKGVRTEEEHFAECDKLVDFIKDNQLPIPASSSFFVKLSGAYNTEEPTVLFGTSTQK